MAKHLTTNDVSAIVDILDGWKNEKLTWERLCEASEAVVGKRPTRQSLNSIEVIKEAFLARKKGVEVRLSKNPLPSSLRAASDRIHRLQNENVRLTSKNSALLEQFIKWQYNAYKYGLTEIQLNESLPRIDRERTENE